MARPLRQFDPGSLLHVISRGNQGEAVFSEADERGLFIERLGQQAQGWDGKLYAYVVMSNHFHLLLEVGKQPLRRLMQPLLTWYAGRYNWRQSRHGHVFHGRYQSVLLAREAHLLEAIRYLHLNPVRAGLVSSPEDYEWSSHAAYCAGADRGWLAAGQGLRMFSDERRSALRSYRQFIRDGLALGRSPELYKSPLPGRHAGRADDFARRERGALALASQLGLPPNEISLADAASGEQRMLLAYAAVVGGGLSAAEVADALGCHRATVRRDLVKARDLRKRSAVFRQRCARLLRPR